WFLRGCPTSRIAKPEVKGAIYRIRRRDASRPNDPRGLAVRWDQLTPKELAGLLDDPRWVVRDRAVHQLGKRGTEAGAVLADVVRKGPTVQARRNAVWALTRIDVPEARAPVRDALSDKEASVRIAAAHSAGLHRDAEALAVLTKRAVADDSPAVRREAATAPGRSRRGATVPVRPQGRHAGSVDASLPNQDPALVTVSSRA